jgi:hypothetical protein
MSFISRVPVYKSVTSAAAVLGATCHGTGVAQCYGGDSAASSTTANLAPVVEGKNCQIEVKSSPVTSLSSGTLKPKGITLSAEEIDASLTCIFSRQDLMEKFIPSDYSQPSPAFMNRLYEAARAVLSDPMLSNNFVLQLAASSQGNEVPTLEPWQELKDKYRCVICQDVLACPTILGPCSHTFCFECIDDYITSCVSLHPGVDVDKRCPTCRTEITHQTFEALLHRDIEVAVSSIPDEEVRKTEWVDRCKKYFEMKKKLSKDTASRSQASEHSTEIKIAMAIAFAAFVFIIARRSLSS